MSPPKEYSEILIDHFMNPRNNGTIENPDGEASIENPACGDIMVLQLRVKDDSIVSAKWKTNGCATSIAASSMISEMIKNMSVQMASNLSPSQVSNNLEGLPTAKMHSAVLVIDALQSSLANYLAKKSRLS